MPVRVSGQCTAVESTGQVGDAAKRAAPASLGAGAGFGKRWNRSASTQVLHDRSNGCKGV